MRGISLPKTIGAASRVGLKMFLRKKEVSPEQFLIPGWTSKDDGFGMLANTLSLLGPPISWDEKLDSSSAPLGERVATLLRESTFPDKKEMLTNGFWLLATALRHSVQREAESVQREVESQHKRKQLEEELEAMRQCCSMMSEIVRTSQDRAKEWEDKHVQMICRNIKLRQQLYADNERHGVELDPYRIHAMIMNGDDPDVIEDWDGNIWNDNGNVFLTPEEGKAVIRQHALASALYAGHLRLWVHRGSPDEEIFTTGMHTRLIRSTQPTTRGLVLSITSLLIGHPVSEAEHALSGLRELELGGKIHSRTAQVTSEKQDEKRGAAANNGPTRKDLFITLLKLGAPKSDIDGKPTAVLYKRKAGEHHPQLLSPPGPAVPSAPTAASIEPASPAPVTRDEV
ncbi:sperm acrosome-associated protein 9 isoform X1 [Narcine bancroftii]|uniref:sperm acrosome-associated protein 9 isoform X1 n=1 Tax=Narcine bancroftii TaxID=1343680 RepID=UPI003831B8C9